MADSEWWRCAECGQIFWKSKFLEAHSRATKHKAYICMTCQKSFTLRTAWVRHESSHSVQKRHQCHHCGKAFHRRDHCGEHEVICKNHLAEDESSAAGLKLHGRGMETKAASAMTQMRGSKSLWQPKHDVRGSSQMEGSAIPELDDDQVSTPLAFDWSAVFLANADEPCEPPTAEFATDPESMETTSNPQQTDDDVGTISVHTCTECPKTISFETQYHLEKHRRECHTLDSTQTIPPRSNENGSLLDRPYISPPSSPWHHQQHPASFQCSLCPKRFTSAASLRAHLRTDERPSFRTTEGNGRLRENDRTRHERIQGEMKLVCKGTLQTGHQWGCGRRFADFNALARHFYQTFGCIKRSGEAAKQQEQWIEERRQEEKKAKAAATARFNRSFGSVDGDEASTHTVFEAITTRASIGEVNDLKSGRRNDDNYRRADYMYP